MILLAAKGLRQSLASAYAFKLVLAKLLAVWVLILLVSASVQSDGVAAIQARLLNAKRYLGAANV